MAASLKPIIDPTPFADQFFRLVDQMQPATMLAVRDALHDVGNESRSFLRRRLTTGRRTGRRYRIFGRDHIVSAPGEFPAKLTGKMARNTAYDVRGASELEVGIRDFGEDYPRYLEFGTRKMLRRPHIEPTSDAHANQLATELVYYSRVSLSKRLGRRFIP